ncbi:hypothetical protein NEOC84_000573|uniref:hypothetical protein n=1 Tax=Neochlamydia sp. AcF84 TaxID=2315858 RepID=UPI00140A3C99|nr:hypothetical protein [Neochlamydia sp. AcF84]NGY94683.1 hypothetical protein [Neochlamydia sp. AcF84]
MQASTFYHFSPVVPVSFLEKINIYYQAEEAFKNFFNPLNRGLNLEIVKKLFEEIVRDLSYPPEVILQSKLNLILMGMLRNELNDLMLVEEIIDQLCPEQAILLIFCLAESLYSAKSEDDSRTTSLLKLYYKLQSYPQCPPYLASVAAFHAGKIWAVGDNNKIEKNSLRANECYDKAIKYLSTDLEVYQVNGRTPLELYYSSLPTYEINHLLSRIYIDKAYIYSKESKNWPACLLTAAIIYNEIIENSLDRTSVEMARLSLKKMYEQQVLVPRLLVYTQKELANLIKIIRTYQETIRNSSSFLMDSPRTWLDSFGTIPQFLTFLLEPLDKKTLGYANSIIINLVDEGYNLHEQIETNLSQEKKNKIASIVGIACLTSAREEAAGKSELVYRRLQHISPKADCYFDALHDLIVKKYYEVAKQTSSKLAAYESIREHILDAIENLNDATLSPLSPQLLLINTALKLAQKWEIEAEAEKLLLDAKL